jgi:hypothetical protein
MDPTSMPFLQLGSEEVSVSRLHALHTTLCYLCSINAHWTAVDAFLSAHPEALLYEGTATLPEESALFIVRRNLGDSNQHLGDCHENRLRLWNMLQQGFVDFKCRVDKRPFETAEAFDSSLSLLIRWEHRLSAWRQSERRIRQQMLEEAASLQHLEDGTSLVCWTACGNPSRVAYEKVLLHLEGEHQEFLRRIRYGRQEQFHILKQAFASVPRFHKRAS